ncbi:tryptophan synthase subunit alpha [Kitasatospora sp. NPDC093102]|uniref:tryptophan synthase subunit alpha n=1 Tax=Kitasatospora sp. NPDC093102 TaxID=3155069 RepID=UPI00341C6492
MPEPLFPPGRLGLALFLNAGDPADRLTDLALMLDEQHVDVLELAVPFPNSPTDGPVIRRSAARALDAGTTLDTVLDTLADLTPRLHHLKVVLLADWSHSLRHRDPTHTARRAAAAGAGALLVHALPPRLRPTWQAALHDTGLPQVTTCYPASTPQTLHTAARDAHGAYVYLVAHYGRSGTTPATGHHTLTTTVTALRTAAPATPVAVGFGVKTAADLQAVAACGADAAIVGSAAVARVEHALTEGLDPVTELKAFLTDLRPAHPHGPGGPGGPGTTPTTPGTTTREEQPAC